jgi:outer membrane protein TolC
MALARYQAQVGTNIDVLDAQAQLTQSEADLTQALSDYQIALARIFVSMGDKNPGLETY